MATTNENVKPKAPSKKKDEEPEINPAIDPNKTAEERLAALTEQQDKARSNS